MDKFNRKFIASIQTIEGDIIEVQSPFSMQFNVSRTIMPTASHAMFKFYNLGPKTRNKLRKNWSDQPTNFTEVRSIAVRAGYGENLPVIFSGVITQCSSTREGTNFITKVDCFDAGYSFASSIIAEDSPGAGPFPAGTSRKTIIEAVAASFPDIPVAAVGDFPGDLDRETSYTGAAHQILKDLTGEQFFVDNGKLFILTDEEGYRGPIEVIDAAAGLLGTPILEQTFLTFDMLFEPRLAVGQQITLKSVTEEGFNGEYKVMSVKHSGIISDTVGGTAVTSVELWSPPGGVRLVS